MPSADTWFDSARAKEMALKSAASKAKRIQDLRNAVETATQSPSLDYRAKRLARVRLQLDRLDEMLLKEQDPQKLDRIASAQAKLAEQERLLSGVPLPGSLRPSSKAGKQRQTYSAPTPEVDDNQAGPEGHTGPENG